MGVILFQVIFEFRGESVNVHPEDPYEGFLDTINGHLLIKRTNDLVAIEACHISPEGLSPAVGEIFVLFHHQVFNIRQVII
ncbi:hypothetical protein D9M69_514240 [compost metagenome]